MKCWSWRLGRLAWYSGYRWDRFKVKGLVVTTSEGQWKPIFLGFFVFVNNKTY